MGQPRGCNHDVRSRGDLGRELSPRHGGLARVERLVPAGHGPGTRQRAAVAGGRAGQDARGASLGGGGDHGTVR